jgi:hypothetical protein
MVKKLLFTAALALILAAPTLAQANVAVLHGISGAVLGLDADLPVDVWVNDAPFLTDFRFGDVGGPLELPAGDYSIAIYLAGSDPEMSDPVLTLDATLADGDNVDIVAHLTPGPGIALTPFVNNATPQIVDPISPRISSRSVRLTVRHAADFPRAALNRLLGTVAEPTLASGEGLSLDLDPGTYRFWLSRAGARRPIFPSPITVALEADIAYNVYAIGSADDGSFQLAIIIRDLP